MVGTGWHRSVFLRLRFCLRKGVEEVAVVMRYCNRGKEGSHCLIKGEGAVILGALGGMWKDQHLFICLFSQTIINLFCISSKLK